MKAAFYVVFLSYGINQVIVHVKESSTLYAALRSSLAEALTALGSAKI